MVAVVRTGPARARGEAGRPIRRGGERAPELGRREPVRRLPTRAGIVRPPPAADPDPERPDHARGSDPSPADSGRHLFFILPNPCQKSGMSPRHPDIPIDGQASEEGCHLDHPHLLGMAFAVDEDESPDHPT
jgi:hypothetical protein